MTDNYCTLSSDIDTQPNDRKYAFCTVKFTNDMVDVPRQMTGSYAEIKEHIAEINIDVPHQMTGNYTVEKASY